MALSGAQRGPDGRYPERIAGDPLIPLVAYIKATALRQAVERELDGFVTTSARADVPELERITGQPATVIDPGEDVVKARLADAVAGELSPECSTALSRWYP